MTTSRTKVVGWWVVKTLWRWRWHTAPVYGWLAGLAVLGAVTPPVLVRYAMVGWTVVSIAGAAWWWRSRPGRGRRLITKYRRRLAGTRMGRGGARIKSLTVLRAGVRLRMQLGQEQDFKSVSRESLAHDLNVPRGALSLEEDLKTGRMVTVLILEVDRFAGPALPHPAPSESGKDWAPGSRSILDPIPLGVTRADEDSRLHIYRDGDIKHGACFGASGSGKSNVLNVITAGVAATDNAIMWVSDAPKSGATFRPWEKVIDWAAYDYDATEAQMDALERLIQARSATVAKSDHDKWKPGRKRPAIIYVIEEFPALYAARPDLGERAIGLILTGRQSGVGMLLCSQGTTWESMPTRLRNELAWIVCLRIKEGALRHVWPAAAGAVDMSMFSVPGLYYASDGQGFEADAIVPARSYALFEPPIRRELAELYGPHRPALDAMSATAAGPAYAARNGTPDPNTTPAAEVDPLVGPVPPLIPTPRVGGVRERLAHAREVLASATEAAEAAAARPVQLPLGDLTDIFASVPGMPGDLIAPDDDVTSRIVDQLRDAGVAGMSKAELGAKLQTSPETVLRRLTRMRAEGRAGTTGGGHATRWHLLDAMVGADSGGAS